MTLCHVRALPGIGRLIDSFDKQAPSWRRPPSLSTASFSRPSSAQPTFPWSPRPDFQIVGDVCANHREKGGTAGQSTNIPPPASARVLFTDSNAESQQPDAHQVPDKHGVQESASGVGKGSPGGGASLLGSSPPRSPSTGRGSMASPACSAESPAGEALREEEVAGEAVDHVAVHTDVKQKGRTAKIVKVVPLCPASTSLPRSVSWSSQSPGFTSASPAQAMMLNAIALAFVCPSLQQGLARAKATFIKLGSKLPFRKKSDSQNSAVAVSSPPPPEEEASWAGRSVHRELSAPPSSVWHTPSIPTEAGASRKAARAAAAAAAAATAAEAAGGHSTTYEYTLVAIQRVP